MRRPPKRETFIALRARRLAHEIARDVLNPHINLTCGEKSGSQVPLADIYVPRSKTCPEPQLWTPLHWVVAFLLATLVFGAFLVLCVALMTQ